MGSAGSCLRLHRADISACQSIQLEWKCWSIPFQYVTARMSAHSSSNHRQEQREITMCATF